ncbi:aminoglycoside adenylyltransferase domain-containing protein [Methylobacterium haplocladii]|uniref:Aminoglycoside (3'') (9) adenylyltransferase n=1 Tax=Methylobacterium haplocladii TaxID=1176176 RepID=A0A512IV76_9HYPH|nr:aminoglycoside adenylyltransferase domain-containing protein [Methylobacterium haplocladii]GEP01612.1 hypothetical protein MHA02_39990 [Methylobacterium haplocladii]GJD85952.1 hypothetical protein HPGCJGGD_3847 [Methylobacterium haplocladii]GLS61272.1 hypothetical protein GCM10007887_39700 [Methylobacterium haplocladii]
MDGLPASISDTVRAYLARVDGQGSGLITGLYLVGSIALGDYREGISDIDFIALVPAELDAVRLEGLARVHAEMAALGSPFFDGVYVTPDRLTRMPGEVEHATFCVEGDFRPNARCFEINPAAWACLARHGITVRGSEPSQLGIATDPGFMRRLQIGNLHSYWMSWIAQAEAALARKRSDEDMAGSSFSWGVLGVTRIARTVATGDIVSKSEAGRWALQTYPPEWRPVIEDALLARDGRVDRVSLDRFAKSLEYMRFVISQAGETC